MALAVFSAGIWARERVITAVKKKPMAAPWNHIGSIRAAKLASGVRPARMKQAMANSTSEMVALIRVSSRPNSLVETGDMTTAITPAGAITTPAQVAM